jgi:hypothetical protein
MLEIPCYAIMEQPHSIGLSTHRGAWAACRSLGAYRKADEPAASRFGRRTLLAVAAVIAGYSWLS